jgi:hypothetical protein
MSSNKPSLIFVSMALEIPYCVQCLGLAPSLAIKISSKASAFPSRTSHSTLLQVEVS